MIAFLDLTALAALFAGGPGRVQVLEAIRSEASLAVAMISKVSMAVLLDDLLREGVPAETVTSIGRSFLEQGTDFVKVPTDVVIMEAMLLSVRHHLKTDPAVQLASALHLERQVLRQAGFLDRPVVLVTLDPDMAAAAQREGLRTAP
ncbi:MAG: hypothetical protein ABSH53_15415 [Holophaga sp.]|jgi:2-methylaconitate cis-trans-isomerase PrpF